MTESDWAEWADPSAMLGCPIGKTTDRKLRLYACASCRHIWYLLIDEHSRAAIEAAEQLSDGLIQDTEAHQSFSLACRASLEIHGGPDADSDTVLRLRRQRPPEKLWRAASMAAFAVGSGV